MPRYKTRNAATGAQEAKFRSPNVMFRSSRRATLAGPAQLMSKQPVSPVVMLEGSVLGQIKKRLSNAQIPQFKSPNKPAAKMTAGKHSPKTVKASTKPKKETTPRSSRHAVAEKSSPKHLSAKRQKSSSSKRKSETPKKRSLSPKLKPESPSHSYSLRSTGITSPKSLRLEESKTQSARKTVKASRKRDRSASPTSKKKTAVPEKRKKSPVAHTSAKETPVKVAGKRKRDIDSEDEDEDAEKVSPPQKKKLLKSENRSPPKKTSTKVVTDTSFTEVKSKTVTANSVKSGRTVVSTSQQNSTPLKPKLVENDVSMNWNVSSIKKKLLDSITPNRMKVRHETPVSANARELKSALFSAKKTDGFEKRTSRRQSVRFQLNGKAETVKELKQRSSRKRFCYRMCQYLLLFGLPAAVTVGTVLVYNGLI